jgi:hypothetical protein
LLGIQRGSLTQTSSLSAAWHDGTGRGHRIGWRTGPRVAVPGQQQLGPQRLKPRQRRTRGFRVVVHSGRHQTGAALAGKHVEGDELVALKSTP